MSDRAEELAREIDATYGDWKYHNDHAFQAKRVEAIARVLRPHLGERRVCAYNCQCHESEGICESCCMIPAEPPKERG